MRKNKDGRSHRPPQKKKAKGLGSLGRRALAFAMAIVLSVGNVLGMFAPAAAYASGGTGKLDVEYEIFYAGWGTNKFTVDGNEGYCANPSKPNPPSGTYQKVSPVLMGRPASMPPCGLPPGTTAAP